MLDQEQMWSGWNSIVTTLIIALSMERQAGPRATNEKAGTRACHEKINLEGAPRLYGINACIIIYNITD